MLSYPSATTEDIEEFLSLLRADASDYLDRTLELMQMTREQFAQTVKTVGQVHRIYSDENPVGYFWIEARDKVLHLHGIIIKHKYQGQGIGSEVLRMLKQGNTGTLEAIELGVHESNVRARKLYERLGFQMVRYIDDLGYYVLQLPLVG